MRQDFAVGDLADHIRCTFPRPDPRRWCRWHPLVWHQADDPPELRRLTASRYRALFCLDEKSDTHEAYLSEALVGVANCATSSIMMEGSFGRSREGCRRRSEIPPGWQGPKIDHAPGATGADVFVRSLVVAWFPVSSSPPLGRILLCSAVPCLTYSVLRPGYDVKLHPGRQEPTGWWTEASGILERDLTPGCRFVMGTLRADCWGGTTRLA